MNVLVKPINYYVYVTYGRLLRHLQAENVPLEQLVGAALQVEALAAGDAVPRGQRERLAGAEHCALALLELIAHEALVRRRAQQRLVRAPAAARCLRLAAREVARIAARRRADVQVQLDACADTDVQY